MLRIRVFNIRYDTDGEDIPLPDEMFFDIEDGEEAEEQLSDLVSERSGFCHFGFDYEVVE